MWDAAQYLRFGGERSRPFFDLLARVGATDPGYVADLGCGPGTLTAVLARRWPAAKVVGVDNSPEMIAAATASAATSAPDPVAPEGGTIAFTLGDVREWQPERPPVTTTCWSGGPAS
jgi:trans-aconitate 2-methyltransferase